MSTADLIVTWTNLLACTFAAGVNFWAARVGWHDWSPLRSATGALAAFYAVGYAVLLAGMVEFAPWSLFFRGFSPVVWLVVWSGPALQSRRVWRRLEGKVREAIAMHSHASGAT